MENKTKLSAKSHIESLYEESEDILDDIIHDIYKRVQQDKGATKKTLEEISSEISFGDSKEPSKSGKQYTYQKTNIRI